MAHQLFAYAFVFHKVLDAVHVYINSAVCSDDVDGLFDVAEASLGQNIKLRKADLLRHVHIELADGETFGHSL